MCQDINWLAFKGTFTTPVHNQDFAEVYNFVKLRQAMSADAVLVFVGLYTRVYHEVWKALNEHNDQPRTRGITPGVIGGDCCDVGYTPRFVWYESSDLQYDRRQFRNRYRHRASSAYLPVPLGGFDSRESSF